MYRSDRTGETPRPDRSPWRMLAPMLHFALSAALAAPSGWKVTRENVEGCELALGPMTAQGIVPMRAECVWPDVTLDRFKEKLPVSPMKNYFPDYEGGDDYAAACDYILNRFVSLNQHETKQIYTHFTCATDTTQIRFVMAAVNGMR